MRVLILGGGELAREMAAAFHKLSVEVVVAGSAADASPAASGIHTPTTPRVAAGAEVDTAVDLRSSGEVLQLIEKVRPDYVVPLTDQVNPEALQAAENFTMVAPSAEAARLTADRETVRDVATRELALPATAYHDAGTLAEFEVAVGQMGYPCLVKPLRGGSNHLLVRGEQDVLAAWEAMAQAVAADGRVLVERFVDFDCEITLLAVRSIDPATGKLATWFCEPIGYLHGNGEVEECWQPMPMPVKAFDNAKSMAARVLNRLGGRGLFAVELFVAEEDVYFSGVCAHPNNTGLVTLTTQRFSQFDLHARAVLGLPVDVTLTSPGACVMFHGASDFSLDDAVARALTVPESDVRLFGQGSGELDQGMTVALATAETVATAVDRAKEVAEILR